MTRGRNDIATATRPISATSRIEWSLRDSSAEAEERARSTPTTSEKPTKAAPTSPMAVSRFSWGKGFNFRHHHLSSPAAAYPDWARFTVRSGTSWRKSDHWQNGSILGVTGFA
jgi:hypothetical protein